MASKFSNESSDFCRSQSATSAVLEIGQHFFHKKLPLPPSSSISKVKVSNENFERIGNFYQSSMDNESVINTTYLQGKNSNDSGVSSPLKSACDFEVEVVMRELKETLDVIKIMYGLQLDLERKLEEYNNEYYRALQERISELSSSDNLEKRLQMLEDFNAHLSKITNEGSEVKQKLWNPISHDTMDVEYFNQKFIVEAFDVAKMLICNFENNHGNIAWHAQNCLEQSMDMESYTLRLSKIIAELQSNVERLIEFRTTLLKIYPNAITIGSTEVNTD